MISRRTTSCLYRQQTALKVVSGPFFACHSNSSSSSSSPLCFRNFHNTTTTTTSTSGCGNNNNNTRFLLPTTKITSIKSKANYSYSQSHSFSTSTGFSASASIKDQTSRDIAEDKYKDKELRLMFDSNAFWKDFSTYKSSSSINISETTTKNQSPHSQQQQKLDQQDPNQVIKAGLFDNPYLTSPQGIIHFTQVSLAQSQALVQKILTDNAEQVSNPGLLIRTLDRLSDTLCQVIDLMGCLLASHPDPQYQAAARHAHETMFEFMNVLNTSVELYDRLDSVFSSPEKIATLSNEEKSVGNLLLSDFKKSGIQLDPQTREKFVKLASVISIKGQEFMSYATAAPTDPRQAFITVPKSQLEGLDPGLARSLSKANSYYTGGVNLFSSSKNGGKNTKYLVPTTGIEAAVALRTIRDEEVRKEIWLQGRLSPDKNQIPRLKTMLHARQDLANLMGQSSYAEYELRDKMVKSPTNVVKFLNRLAQDIFPKAQREVAELGRLKQQATDIPNKTSEIQAWDRDFFGARYLHQQHLLTDHRDDIPTKDQVSLLPEYFSLGTVMQGLSRLFSSIYGIKFVPVEPKPGETWREDVRRLDVVSEDEGLIGVMYCDLFQAPDKSPNPAHFTVRCSRRIFAEENDEIRAMDPLASQRYRRHGPKSLNSGDGINDDEQQLPIIVLMCDFSPMYYTSEPGTCLLSFTEVETLFHEMGHAMHSMLGRTALHNVSGTRCATDFVELPSVLMERFASAPQVLALYAHHHISGEPLPYSLVQEYQRTTKQLLQYSETYSQIKLALLDQLFHSNGEEEEGKEGNGNGKRKNVVVDNLSSAYYKLESENGLFPAHPKNDWYTQFGHLVGYGASYYCYLFDRAIADRVWEHVFRANPISREAGEKWRNEVLKWGGSKDPWEMVASILDTPELRNGDESAIVELAYSHEKKLDDNNINEIEEEDKDDNNDGNDRLGSLEDSSNNIINNDNSSNNGNGSSSSATTTASAGQ